MSSAMQFKATQIASEINRLQRQMVQLYQNHGLDAELKNFENQINRISQDEKIRLVFIGQYSAGKSSIIASLTQDQTILIDSNVSTCKTADYSWNGVVLTDTPGLYSGNVEHDAITIDMIRRADLVVYCITSDLFNPTTLKDFKRWAYDEKYKDKMFLVVNKMSKELGDYEELRNNYVHTLNQSLSPHSISDFTNSFIDAKDYKDGVQHNNQQLIEYSRFSDFIAKLNDFVREKGLLGKMDKPIMIMKASIEEVSVASQEDPAKKMYDMLLSRIRKRVEQLRSEFQRDSDRIISAELYPIKGKGAEIADQVGEKEVQFGEEDCKKLIENVCENLDQQLLTLWDEYEEKLQEATEEVLESDVAKVFLDLMKSRDVNKKFFTWNKEQKNYRFMFDSVNQVLKQVAGKVVQFGVKEGTKGAGKVLYQAKDIAGSTLHSVIKMIGKKMGHAFKPWEAVKIAQNVTNIANAIVPIMSVVGAAMEIKEAIDEENAPLETLKIKEDVRKQFDDLYNEVKKQYDEEYTKKVSQALTQMIMDIQKQENEAVERMESQNKLIKQLAEIKKELILVQNLIFE